MTLEGEKVTVDGTGGIMANELDALLVPVVPVMAALALVETGTVLIAKVPVELPLAMVTLGGTDAAGFALFRLTTTPAVGALAVKVTVPVAEVPPRSEVGDRDRDSNVGTSTPRSWVMFTPP